MVPEGDRLGGLQMRKARHDPVSVIARAPCQRLLQHAQAIGRFARGAHHPELEIGRHLIVARAGGVQTLAGLADTLGQARFDIEVDVFQLRRERERACDDFPGDLV